MFKHQPNYLFLDLFRESGIRKKIAFVKVVDLETPDDRITEALKKVGLGPINLIRLNGKMVRQQQAQSKYHSAMHKIASQNTKPLQCYIGLKYNHVTKYWKTKQNVCIRCGENDRMDQYTVANDAVKCCSCKGSLLATSDDCSYYKEQGKKMLNLINQHATTSIPVTSAPGIYNTNEFSPLVEDYQQQKISDSDSNEERQVVKYIKNKQQQNAEAAKSITSSIYTLAKPTTNTKVATSKPPRKQKEATKSATRVRSPSTTLDTSPNDNKDLKTSDNDV